VSQNYSYFFAFCWGLAVLFSFIGFGRALSSIAGWKNKEILGWGMQAALGIAVVISIAGVLLLFSLAHQPVLVALVVIGVLLCIVFVFSDTSQKKFSTDLEYLKKDIFLWVLAIIIYATSVAWSGSIDPTDDFQGYITMPEKISQTGTLSEPFGLRRAYTLGGHVFLKALVQCVTSERTGHLLDMGICKLIIFGLLLGLTREMRTTAPLLRFCFIFLVLIIPVPRINTNSSLTGVCLLVPALFLLDSFFKEPNKKLAIQIGLLIAAAITMRSIYIGPLGAACAIYAGWNCLETKNRNSIILQFRQNLNLWFVAFAALASWFAISQMDCGTPLPLFFGGNINPEFANTGSKEGILMDASIALAFIFQPEVCVFLIIALLPLFFDSSRFVKASCLATLICVFYIALKGGACLTRDLYRFCFPIILSQVILSFTELSRLSFKSDEESNIKQGVNLKRILAIAVSLSAMMNFSTGFSFLSETIASLYHQICRPGPFLPPKYQQEYIQLQGIVPKGEKILAAVDAPYLLDYTRNQIANADVIGGMSPKRGMPFFKGPEALKKYLLDQNIKYILAVDWDKGLVSYNSKNITENKREWFVNEVQTPYALNFMDNVDLLDKSEKSVVRGATCRLIELSSF
jgi:hypothetical protein